MILWTSEDAAHATGGQVSAVWNASGVSIDTRTLTSGDLYIALKGHSLDGHSYVVKALECGAVAAVVDHIPEGCPPEKCLIVKDTLTALQDLGRAARARTKAQIIAVTGSVGKTGTKDMLSMAFSEQCRTHASQKSFNNHWGVPLTLAKMPLDTEVGIFEVGMNHAGELSALSQVIQPDMAIITTVEAVHVEYFSDGEQGIACAKAEIFEGLPEGGYALLNNSNKWFSYLSTQATEKKLQVIPFGCPDNLSMTPEATTFEASVMDETLEIQLSVSGAHHAGNAMAVLTAIKLCGYNVSMAGQALSHWVPRDGRGKREQIIIDPGQPPAILIDESYNASPVAMRAAFSTLKRLQPEGAGRRIAVLGDMAELGEKAATYHADLAEDLCAANVDKVYVAGPYMKYLFQNLPAEKQTLQCDLPVDVCAALIKNILPGDIVLVKGSRGGGEKPKMQVIVEAIQALSHQKKEDKK